ncbi:peptidyl-tRNA hydrolase, chloroplastic-like isoform X1 [Rhododendron vialii]|uniref:peptidyl-tRNA hydrolase, chloroplastic-like isoform X1 n=1 Tax=Rhododendron vialii TaxID=182163 RepID=UPI00265DFA00|nr:peptidyl-tRNA hydrolase, chloroplastic-like isoform X1 [Rhododendron vialii]
MNAVGGSISSSASLFSLGAVRFFNWPLLISSYSSSPSSKILIPTYSNNRTLKSITMPQSSSSSASTTQPSAAEAVTPSPSEVAVEATKPKPKPWLIVGLGNPGKMYNGTRHNVGFEMVDAIAEAEGISMSCVSNKAIFGKGLIGNVPVMLAKPQTFMNASGQSVGAIVSYHKIPLKQVLVIFDDLDLPFAKLRLLPKGGHGGHNGMRSVIDHFKGSKDFPRLRIGIGRPPGKMNPVSFVMRAFNKQERQELDFAFQNGIEAVRILLLEGFDKSATFVNSAKYLEQLS